MNWFEILYVTTRTMTSSPLVNGSDVTEGGDPVITSTTFSWFLRHDDGRPWLHYHWQKHRDVIDSAPEWLIYVLGVYITIVGVVAISGNLTVVLVFVRLYMI